MKQAVVVVDPEATTTVYACSLYLPPHAQPLARYPLLLATRSHGHRLI